MSSPRYFHQIEILSTVNVNDHILSWGKFDWGNNCLVNFTDNLNINNCIFRACNNGIHSVNVDFSYASNLLLKEINYNEYAGIYFLAVEDGFINKSIFNNSINGVKLKDGFIGSIEETQCLI